MQSGDTVAYNTHSSPGCTSSWETVCDESGHVNQNGCEKMAGFKHMTEAECKEYTANNGLKEHNPFAGSWGSDCKCMQSGDTVAYNTHSSPGCTSSWETVCDVSD